MKNMRKALSPTALTESTDLFAETLPASSHLPPFAANSASHLRLDGVR